MRTIKKFNVGLIKSVMYDVDKGQMRGIIETVNDKENPELPFVTDAFEDIEKGKMVKFVKEVNTIVTHAVEVKKL